MGRRGARAVVALLAVAGCGGGAGMSSSERPADATPADRPPAPHVLASICVSPQSQVDFIDDGVPATQAFTATGVYADGTTADVTAQASWVVENPSLGSFPSGVGENVLTSTTMGGYTRIEAIVGSVTGASILTLVPRRTVPPLDVFFVTPYLAPASPGPIDFDFGTTVQQVDLGLVIDSSATMGSQIAGLRGALSSIASTLMGKVPSLAMGVADFSSWPCAPDGAAGDHPWRLDNRIITVATTAGLSAIDSALGSLVAGGGGDDADPALDAAWFGATGSGGDDCAGGTIAPFDAATAPGGVPGATTGTLGGMGFRQAALPVVALATDAESHDAEDAGDTTFAGATYAHGHDAVAAALQAIDARVVGLASTCGGATFSPIFTGAAVASCGFEPHAQLAWLAEQTGGRVPVNAFASEWGSACASGLCCTGVGGAGQPPDADGECPLVFDVPADGSGAGGALKDALVKLVTFGLLDVSISVQKSSTGLPSGHTLADFFVPSGAMRGLVPLGSTPVVGAPGGPSGLDASTGTFLGVTPGTTVRYQVGAYNDFVPELTSGPQFFTASLFVHAGPALLDYRNVYVIVPPASLCN